jgi:diguanylate cyclase (GGDEF)-like protein
MDDKLALLEKIGIPVWVFDVDNSRIVWSNQGGLDHWKAASVEELRERDLSVDMSPTVRKRLLQYQEDCCDEGITFSEDWTLYPDGVPQTSRVEFCHHELEDGRAGLLVQIIGEISETTSTTLHSAQALLHTSAMIQLYDHELIRLYTNPAARSVVVPGGNSLANFIKNQSDLEEIQLQLSTHRSCDVEFEVNTVDGVRWHALNIQESPDPVTGNKTLLVSSTDVTDRRIAQAHALSQAHTDSLTGLPNRVALLEKMHNQLAVCADHSLYFSVLFLDLDRFKLVNDSLGHSVGDALLVAVANKLRTAAGDMATVARLSGDEFVIVTRDHDTADAELATRNQVIQGIFRHTAGSSCIDGHTLRVSPSIGISRYPSDGQTATALLQNADIAMYAAKSAGCGHRTYEQGMNQSTLDRLALETDLALALESDQFVLYYQPKIDCKTFAVSGVEALIRWDHPAKGMISPFDFIPVAEETGMIFQIGEWVMRQAMRDQVRWKAAGHDISVAINISPKQFMANDLAERIDRSIADTGVDPECLNIEVTESMLIVDETYVYDLLNSLSRKGIKISIDDFGTGYSNLANLQKYPVSCLKIDRNFVNAKETALLEIILEMGNKLGMAVVAEGVETMDQIRWLRKHQCDELQGFFFSKPLPFDELTDFMAAHHTDRFLVPVAA